jgi:hypothetical protein
MKKIIRLTESDLSRIVKQTILELDRSTYEKAADSASQRGYSKLGNRFREHGKEFGLNQERDNIVMVVKYRDEEQTLNVRINSIEGDPGYSKSYVMKTEDTETGNKKTFMISKYPGEMEFYLSGDYPSLPKTRMDGKKVLKAFENSGIDTSDIDPRSISYDDTDF